MFNHINRENINYSENFQNYLNSSISNDDRDILNDLSQYITDSAYQFYLTAFDNYHFDENIIQQNNNIISNISDFWRAHKSHVHSMLDGAVDSSECPVCGLSYNPLFHCTKSVEHILPKSKYHQYTFSPFNLVYFCNNCNAAKGNKVESSIFHPLISNISCSGIPEINFIRNGCNINIKVEINEPNVNYRELIYDLYKVPSNYEKFIKKLINEELNSIEVSQVENLKTLNINQKQTKLSRYLQNVYSCQPSGNYIISDTENLIVEKLKSTIKNQNQADIFADYILSKSHVLRDC